MVLLYLGINMLIKEIRDFNKDVPEKKIILDQMGPQDVADLVMQIAAFAVIDMKRGHPEKVKDMEMEDIDGVEGFVRAVMAEIDHKLNTPTVKKLIKAAEEGKVK